MFKRLGYGVVCLILAFCSCVSGSSAQNVTGSIQGTVLDPAGAEVPNATVSVTNADQNIVVRTVTTDEHGLYSVPLLPVGRYSVSAEIKGFKKAVRSGIVLNVSDRLGINFTLEVGAVTEVISVQGDTVHVDTESATASGVISGTQLKELSLNSRNSAAVHLRRLPACSTESRLPAIRASCRLA